MEESQPIQREKQLNPLQQGLVMPAIELKRITDLFSILIEIDKEQKEVKESELYGKSFEESRSN